MITQKFLLPSNRVLVWRTSGAFFPNSQPRPSPTRTSSTSSNACNQIASTSSEHNCLPRKTRRNNGLPQARRRRTRNDLMQLYLLLLPGQFTIQFHKRNPKSARVSEGHLSSKVKGSDLRSMFRIGLIFISVWFI